SVTTSSRVIDDVRELRSHVGFIAHEVDDPRIVRRALLTEDLVLVAPPGHELAECGPVTVAGLEGRAMVMHEPGSSPRRIAERVLRAAGVTVTVPLELSSNETIKKAVAAGYGVAFISPSAVQQELADGSLVAIPLSGPALSRTFSAIWAADQELPPPLRQLVTALSRGR
ncbi:MAG: LysR substrate-binding domain-containing protein, partial [Dehalococcoidia bacterium]